MIRFVDLAETFHLPILYLVDCPGFAIGLDAEKSATIRHGVRVMAAVNQSTVPWCSIMVRNAFGVAGVVHQPAGRLSMRYAWPSAWWGSLPLEGGIEAAYRADIDAAEDQDSENAGDRRPAQRAAFAAAQRRSFLGRGDARSARYAQNCLRVRQSRDAVAQARPRVIRHATVNACADGTPAPRAPMRP